MPAFPKYERYKDSGVDWFKELPDQWRMKRNLGVFDERKELNHPDLQLLSVTIERGIIRQEQLEDKRDSSNEDKSKYKVVRKFDLAYNKMRMWQGAIGMAPEEGIVSPAYIILSTREKFYAKYFHYLYRSPLFIAEAGRLSYGLCDDMNSLRYEHFKTIYTPLPPIEDVGKIVSFLDRKTAEIDDAILKKGRLIELLLEQKAIRINQAVTQGLHPDAPMQDSGIDWLGQIPKHWKVWANRYVFAEQNSRSEIGEETHLSMSQKLGLVPASELAVLTLQSESYAGAKLCSKGDLVLNRLKAHLAVFSVAPCDGLVSPDYSVFRLRDRNHAALYFEHLFKTPAYLSELNRRVRGIVIGFYRLYSDDFKAIPCLLPPPEEQEEIIRFIRHVSEDTAKIRTSITREIAALKELKTVLISEAVTGKIKV